MEGKGSYVIQPRKDEVFFLFCTADRNLCRHCLRPPVGVFSLV